MSEALRALWLRGETTANNRVEPKPIRIPRLRWGWIIAAVATAFASIWLYHVLWWAVFVEPLN